MVDGRLEDLPARIGAEKRSLSSSGSGQLVLTMIGSSMGHEDALPGFLECEKQIQGADASWTHSSVLESGKVAFAMSATLQLQG